MLIIYLKIVESWRCFGFDGKVFGERGKRCILWGNSRGAAEREDELGKKRLVEQGSYDSSTSITGLLLLNSTASAGEKPL